MMISEMESVAIVNLVDRLKARSGKSEKLMIKDVVYLEEENSHLCFVHLANADVKLSVLMKQTDAAKYSLEIGKCVTAKNLDNVKVVGDIPIFKVVKTSSFRESRIMIENTLEFVANELADIKRIDVTEFAIDKADVTERAGPSRENITLNKEVLSLTEFFQMDPKQIKKDQYVEVLSFVLL